MLACVRTAVGASLIPSINSMRSLGIVWIPGLMAGMLLTGTNPLYAAVYRFVVVTLMYAAACWSWRRRMLCAAASSRLRRSCCCGPGPRGS